MQMGDQKNVRILIAAVLLAGTGMLAARAVHTMHEVSATRSQTDAEAKGPGSSRINRMKATMEERREARHAAASLPRDPFRGPSAQPVRENDGAAVQTAEAVATPAKPATASVPALRALVYDNVRPSVQLACEDAISPWLGQGDTFKGWTVLEIGPGSVWIRNGSRKQELGLN